MINNNKLFSERISVESINYQQDKAIVVQLSTVFTEIHALVSEQSTRTKSVKTTTKLNLYLTDINKLISDRFGINFKVINSADNLIGVQTTPPDAYNILAGDVTLMHKQISDYINTKNPKIRPEDLDSVNSNKRNMAMLKNYQKSVNAVTSAMMVDGIFVDLKHAKIRNYPKDAKAIVLINLFKLINDINWTPMELVAGLMHEIGHGFDHILYAHRTMRANTAIIDAIMDGNSSNKSPKNIIELSYKISNKMADNPDEHGSPISMTVGIIANYMYVNRNIGGNISNVKDSERAADTFAVKFGLGLELGSALKKIELYGEHIVSKYTIRVTDIVLIYTLLLTVSIFIPILLGTLLILGGVFTAVVSWYVVWSIIIYGVGNIIRALFSKGVDDTIIYDDTKRRIKRIKNDTIRGYRTGQITKDEHIMIVQTIDTLDDVINATKVESGDVIFKMVGKFFDHARDQKGISDLDNIVDDMINNDLHIASQRIDTLIQEKS